MLPLDVPPSPGPWLALSLVALAAGAAGGFLWWSLVGLVACVPARLLARLERVQRIRAGRRRAAALAAHRAATAGRLLVHEDKAPAPCSNG